MRKARPMDEVVDFTPHREAPFLTTRGAIYAALRADGESDFIAASYAFNARPAAGVAAHGFDDVRALLAA